MVRKFCANCNKDMWIEYVGVYQFKKVVKSVDSNKTTTRYYCCNTCMQRDLEKHRKAVQNDYKRRSL